MKRELRVFAILLLWAVSAECATAAVEAGFSGAVGSRFYGQIPNFGINWIGQRSLTCFSSEFYAGPSERDAEYDDPGGLNNIGFGLNFAFMEKFLVNNLYTGPSIGFTAFLDLHESSIYFIGWKTTYVIGDKNVRLQVSHRILGGFKTGSFSILNNLGIGLEFLLG
jgi:hypothetical protein